MKKTLFFIFITAFSLPAVACLNEYYVMLNGDAVDTESSYPLEPFGYKNSMSPDDIKTNLENRKQAYEKTKSLENYSDYGVALVRDGQYAAAKKIFLEIEKQKPGLYATSANLGTTYELLGKNDSALYWIRKAVAINPRSHKGSEWIHVKILEAKNNTSIKDLYHYNILSVNFGRTTIPKNLNSAHINIDSLLYQLDYQLEERVFFVKPKDAVMGQLLFQFGNVIAMKGTLKGAVDIYHKAREYGYTDELMDERIKLFSDLQAKEDEKRDNDKNKRVYIFATIFIMIIASPVIIPVAIIIYYRRKKKRKTN